MRKDNFEMRLLVRGKPITEFPHEGQFFVEGRADSEFEIEFKNHGYSRAMAVLSVDGLSVIDGKPAGAESTGYLIHAYETVRVPGWKLNEQQIAKFVFAGRHGSYVEQAGGDARNRGVVGALVYAEKVQQPIYWNNFEPWHGVTGSPWGTTTYSNSTGVRGMSAGIGSASMSPGVSVNVTDHSSYTADVQSLGTGLGAAADFKTTMVTFERGDVLATMVLYYDDRKGLRRRGIKIERPSRQRHAVQPQAFPGMACQPPPNWKG